MRPLGPLLLCGAILVAAVAAQNPLVIGAAALAAALVLAAAPGPRRAYVLFALVPAVFVMLLNPFLSVQGLTPLLVIGDPPLLDGEITEEELMFGLAAGLRIIGSALAIAVFVRISDGDLLLRGISRVAPRSATIVALGARLLPTLERDASGFVVAARARGLHPSGRRAAADLVAPLVSLSLERSLTLAEAMEARGYGAGNRTRAELDRPDARDRSLTLLGAAAGVVVTLVLVVGDGYSYYDLLDDPFVPGAMAAAAALTAIAAAAALVVRWRP